MDMVFIIFWLVRNEFKFLHCEWSFSCLVGKPSTMGVPHSEYVKWNHMDLGLINISYYAPSVIKNIHNCFQRTGCTIGAGIKNCQGSARGGWLFFHPYTLITSVVKKTQVKS